jgi:hypothetical protein
MKLYLFFALSTMVFILNISNISYTQESKCNITLSNPADDGMPVGKGMIVSGKAAIQADCHLWILVHRIDYKGVWYPQGEAIISPTDSTWSVWVQFGEPADIGWKFEIAALVVNSQDDALIADHLMICRTTGNWTPMAAPKGVCPPVVISVKKTSHQ